MADQIYITECPRDAWQGIHTFIPTELKVEYLKKVWTMGFDTIDYTSFVSPKAIPQMADADQVTESLSLKPGANKEGKALAIVANIKGAERASQHKFIDQLGFPLSLSEQFQQRNTNRSIAEALLEVRQIAQIVKENKKELVVYLSMAFGNPYNEVVPETLMQRLVEELVSIGINTISLADTIGAASPLMVQKVFKTFIVFNADITWKCHLHTRPENAMHLLEAAYSAGCRYFEGAIGGYGGCPMAADTLTGNMPTEQILEFARVHGLKHNVNEALILQTANSFRLMVA